jgi:ABC-type protease/lipase transport system fused ATPase/permease subunit
LHGGRKSGSRSLRQLVELTACYRLLVTVYHAGAFYRRSTLERARNQLTKLLQKRRLFLARHHAGNVVIQSEKSAPMRDIP